MMESLNYNNEPVRENFASPAQLEEPISIHANEDFRGPAGFVMSIKMEVNDDTYGAAEIDANSKLGENEDTQCSLELGVDINSDGNKSVHSLAEFEMNIKKERTDSDATLDSEATLSGTEFEVDIKTEENEDTHRTAGFGLNIKIEANEGADCSPESGVDLNLEKNGDATALAEFGLNIKREENEEIGKVFFSSSQQESVGVQVNGYPNLHVVIAKQTQSTFHSRISSDCPKCHMSFTSEYHTLVCITKCNFCKKVCANRASLKAHMVVHTNMNKFKCNVCGEGFRGQSYLAVHRTTVHLERPYKCEMCGKGFSQKGHLTSHKVTHTGELPFACVVCKKKFSRAYVLQKHMRAHRDKGQFHKCNVCGMGFSRKSILSKHKLFTHSQVGDNPGNKPPNTCSICGLICQRKSGLISHMSTHTKERWHKCVCGKSFGQKVQLKKHVSTHSVCQQKHVKLKEATNNGPATSEEIINLEKLEDHDAKQFTVGRNDSFDQEGSLTQDGCDFDGKASNPINSKRNYTCEKCGEKFGRQAVLFSHMQSHLVTPPTEGLLDQHSCDECGKWFSSDVKLQNHILIHTGKRSYKCGTCEKTFKLKRNFAHHMSMDPLCGKASNSMPVNGEMYHKCHQYEKDFIPSVCTPHMQTPSLGLTEDMRNVSGVSEECIFRRSISISHSEIQEVTDVNDRLISCQFCGSAFPSCHDFHAHLLTHVKRQLYDCNLCVEGFMSEEYLINHLKGHIESDTYDWNKTGQFGVVQMSNITVPMSIKHDLSQHMLARTVESPHNIRHSEQLIKVEEDNTTNDKFISPRPIEDQVTVEMNENSYMDKINHKYPNNTHGGSFQQESDWMQHVILSHRLETPQESSHDECGVCGKGFVHQADLLKHSLTHMRVSSHKRSACGKALLEGGKSFLEIPDLTQYMHADESTGESFYCCETCGNRYSLMADFAQHINEEYYKCDVCGRCFEQLIDIAAHMPIHSVKLIQDFVKKPAKKPTVAKLLAQAREQPNEKKQIQAQSRKVELYYKCSVCGNRFVNNDFLSHHMQSHKGELPGTDCSGIKNEPSVTKSGSILVCGPRSQNTYSCTVCHRRFLHFSKVKEHMLSHADGEDSENKKYFIKAGLINVGLAPKNQEATYKCGVCTRRFAQINEVAEHMLIHNKGGTGLPQGNDAILGSSKKSPVRVRYEQVIC